MKRFRLLLLIWIVLVVITGALLFLLTASKKSRSQTPSPSVPDAQYQKIFEKAKETPWNTDTQQISGRVVAVDKRSSSLKLHVNWPPSAPIHDKDVWTKIACPSAEVVIDGSDAKDILAVAQANDNFYGYCADTACSSVKKGCHLQKG